jgi:hypothetical protein
MIEKEIFAYLKRQHKKMEYLPFATWQSGKGMI